MANLTTFITRIGGVLLPPPGDHLLDCLDNLVQENLTSQVHSEIREIVAGHEISGLDTEEFFRELASRVPLPLDQPKFLQILRDRLSLRPDTVIILSQLAKTHRSVLLIDYPQSWLAGLKGAEHIASLIRSDTSIQRTEILQVNDMGPGLLHLLDRAECPLDQALYIDSHSEWTSAAVRIGLNAILYVNPFRLRQELVLRGLLVE